MEREVKDVDIPSELRPIGPLFVGLFIILWIRRGPIPFLILFVFPLMLFTLVPPFLLGFIVVAFFLYIVKDYRLSLIIFIVSFLGSGVLLEYMPIYYPGPYPPPPPMIPTIMLTPFTSVFMLIMMLARGVFDPSVLTLLVLIMLPFLTAITFQRGVERKMNPVKAMIVIVTIILIWTFLIFPIADGMGSENIVTPLPLGPLVALTILPWIPVRKDETPLSQDV